LRGALQNLAMLYIRWVYTVAANKGRESSAGRELASVSRRVGMPHSFENPGSLCGEEKFRTAANAKQRKARENRETGERGRQCMHSAYL